MDYFVKSPRLLSRLISKSVVWQMPPNNKTIYLTFDDGPIPELTPQVLDILDIYNIKATFFCVGHNVEKHPIEFHEICKRGHAIGNHTYNHLKGWKTTSSNYFENIKLFEKHAKTDLFRPPYGKITPHQLFKLRGRYKIILWSVLTYDFDQNIKPEKCYQNSIRYTKDGSIVVFHDNIKATKNLLYALPKFIEYFQNKGYKFDIISSDKLKSKTENKFRNRLYFKRLKANSQFCPPV